MRPAFVKVTFHLIKVKFIHINHVFIHDHLRIAACLHEMPRLFQNLLNKYQNHISRQRKGEKVFCHTQVSENVFLHLVTLVSAICCHIK